MSGFRFLHAADLHLGSPFRGLALKDADVAQAFAAATRAAFSDLVTRALEEEVAFVVISGDVYDGDWKDNSIGLFFAREMARLARAGIPVFLVKGNHDAESVVTKTITLPDNVTVFSAARAETFEIEALQVALHGRSFPDRAVPENYAVSYPDPRPGWFNLGVLHTSADGRPGHATYAPCTVEELRLRGYDYWALGHVHEHEILARDPWVVFPGNLQGRSVRECGPKGAMLVDVQDGRVLSAERMIVDRARWAELAIDVGDVEDEPEALRLVEEALDPLSEAAEDRLMAVRVRLRGATPLHGRWTADPRRLSDEVLAALQRRHADAWLERLRLETRAPGGQAAADPGLSSIDLASMLDGLERDGDLAARAADLLATISAKMPGGMDQDDVPSAEDLDALLAEARDLVLARAGGS